MKLPRYKKYHGMKVRQDEYGNHIDMIVSIKWWYMVRIYVREFFKALSRIKLKK